MEYQPDLEGSEAVVDPSQKEEGESVTPATSPETQSAPALAETHERAGFWLRLVAFSIDMVILIVFALLLLLVGMLATNLSDGLDDFLIETEEGFPLFPLWISGMLTATA